MSILSYINPHVPKLFLIAVVFAFVLSIVSKDYRLIIIAALIVSRWLLTQIVPKGTMWDDVAAGIVVVLVSRFLLYRTPEEKTQGMKTPVWLYIPFLGHLWLGLYVYNFVDRPAYWWCINAVYLAEILTVITVSSRRIKERYSDRFDTSMITFRSLVRTFSQFIRIR